MRRSIKKALAGVTAAATAAVIAPLMTTPAAYATPPAAQTGAGISPNSGLGSTAFQLSLPAGASCDGDSANSFWLWQSYMVPASVDPATLTFNANGPVPADVGANFRQPLFDPFGTPLVQMNTAPQDTPGGPGLIINIPQADFQVFSGGHIPPGAYNVGIACTFGPPSATQLDSFWNVKMTVSTDAAGGNAQVSWIQGAVDNAPVLNSVTPGDGTLTAAFTPDATGTATGANAFTATATPMTGGGAPVTVNGSGSPLTFNGLTNGTEYAVTVHSNNSVGASAESNTINGTPNLTRLPVQNLTAVPGTAAGTVDVSWKAPLDMVAYPPTGYTVTDGTTTATVTPTATDTLATVYTHTFTGLTGGTGYTFTVTPTYASGPVGNSASTTATPNSAAIMVQNVTVTRPVGALVLTQVCGVHDAFPVEAASLGFPTGLPAVTAVTAADVLTAGGEPIPTEVSDDTLDDERYPEYPYPVLPDGTSDAVKTSCGLDLGPAQFVATGSGAGQFFATSGILSQVTIVDTRVPDVGWETSGTMSDFESTDTTDTFSGSQLGWQPFKVSDTAQFTDSDGVTYDQVTTKGAKVNPNVDEDNATDGISTLSEGATLGSALGQTPTATGFTGGLGIARFDARLKLLIPVTNDDGDYSATLTLNAF